MLDSLSADVWLSILIPIVIENTESIRIQECHIVYSTDVIISSWLVRVLLLASLAGRNLLYGPLRKTVQKRYFQPLWRSRKPWFLSTDSHNYGLQSLYLHTVLLQFSSIELATLRKKQLSYGSLNIYTGKCLKRKVAKCRLLTRCGSSKKRSTVSF